MKAAHPKGQREDYLLHHGYGYYFKQLDHDTVEMYGHCPDCGCQMRYAGFKCFDSYVALMICRECGREDEF